MVSKTVPDNIGLEQKLRRCKGLARDDPEEVPNSGLGSARKTIIVIYSGYGDRAGVTQVSGNLVKRFPVGNPVYIAGSFTRAWAKHAICEFQAHILPDIVSLSRALPLVSLMV